MSNPVIIGNVMAARKRLAKTEKPLEASNDDEFRRRKVKYATHDRDFKKALLRAAR